MMDYIVPPKKGNQVGFPWIVDMHRIFPNFFKFLIIIIIIIIFYWLITLIVSLLADKYHTTSSKHLVKFANLNRILKSEIFLHKDGKLRVVHVILRFEPLSKRFQSPKNVIKTKDLRLALIDVTILDFLLTEPPLAGT